MYTKGFDDTYYYLNKFYSTGNLNYIESAKLIHERDHIVIENNNMSNMNLSGLINNTLIKMTWRQPVKIKVTNHANLEKLLDYYDGGLLFDNKFFTLKENQIHLSNDTTQTKALMYSGKDLVRFEVERSDCGLVLISFPRISSDEALSLLDKAFSKLANRRTVMYIGETTHDISNAWNERSSKPVKDSLLKIGFNEVATYKNPNYNRQRTVLTKKY